MTQIKKTRYALIAQILLFIAAALAFPSLASAEVKHLIIAREQILLADVKLTLRQANIMAEVATGPHKGDMDYLKPIHAELLAKTSNMESLNNDLQKADVMIRLVSMVSNSPSAEWDRIPTYSRKLYMDYSTLKNRLRYLTQAMDVSSYDFTITQSFIRMNERSVATLEKLLNELSTSN
jgi:hypothetical protein